MKIGGYVDDGRSSNVKGAKRRDKRCQIKETFTKVESWATQNGMVFDLAKFEAIHFSQK